MNETRPSDTISNDLMAMRHAHEAITIALKSGEYNGEIISAKEQKKLPIKNQGRFCWQRWKPRGNAKRVIWQCGKRVKVKNRSR